MRDKKEFFGMVQDLDGKPVDLYSQLAGDFDFSRYVIKIGDFVYQDGETEVAFTVRVPQIIGSFPSGLYDNPVRRMALEDYLIRQMAFQFDRLASFDGAGIARRHLTIAGPGQKILPRTAMVVADEYVEARVGVYLPEQDGLINGAVLRDIFFEEIPDAVNAALIYCNLDHEDLRTFVETMEDADQVRQLLPAHGLVSFAAEGSLLNRETGSDAPDASHPHRLTLDPALRVDLDVPNKGRVAGIGIREGITVILGGLYSGRVELMQALAAGIFNHIPGDGREFVISAPDAVYIANDPLRSVQKVNVGAFIGRKPDGSTEQFSATEAGPFESQAASLVEQIEVGAGVLLFDESDSAPAFLSADGRIDGFTEDANSELTPLAGCARRLVDDLGVSLIVAGSSSVAEFIPIADTVLRISGYRVEDVTEEAKAKGIEALRKSVSAEIGTLSSTSRWVIPSSIDASAGVDDTVVNALGSNLLEFGKSVIDLSAVRQIADPYQLETIGQILYYIKLRYLDEARSLREILDMVDEDLTTEGLECLSRDLKGNLARPRRYEIAAALNRLDTLRILKIDQV
jgi:predicted ABC-class ATPase